MKAKSKGQGKILQKQNEKNKKSPQAQVLANLQIYYIKALKADSEWYTARILNIRTISKIKLGKHIEQQQYLVHFMGQNQRLDEWLDTERTKMTKDIIEDQSTRKQQKPTTELTIQEKNDIISPFTKNINEIQIGKFRCQTWYHSPLPSGYQNLETLFFCEQCLNYYISQNELTRHNKKCTIKNPPGNEIYRDEGDDNTPGISLYEIDGEVDPVYALNLGFLSKLFLDQKWLFDSLHYFLFYVLCENDQFGSHIVGYFSKPKTYDPNNNLNCIMTLPSYQRKGYGKCLITFSYELSLIEGKFGQPEGPLSDLGEQTYINWWTQRIIQYLLTLTKDQDILIPEIEKNTGILADQIVEAMEISGLIKYEHKQGVICTDRQYLDQVYKKAGRPGRTVIAQNIHWVPYNEKLLNPKNMKIPEYNPIQSFNQNNNVYNQNQNQKK